jgi:hypothetical protein
MSDEFAFSLDWDLLLRFRRAGAKFARVPRFIGAFRVHDAQKTTRHIATSGDVEIRRLRRRELDRDPTTAELRRHVRGYVRRHILLDRLYRAGILRY